MKIFCAVATLVVLLEGTAADKTDKNLDEIFAENYDSAVKAVEKQKRVPKSSVEAEPVVGDLLNPDCDIVNAEAFKEECKSFCTEFFNWCVNPNYHSSIKGYDECVEKCALWPRTKSTVSRPPTKFYHLHSDTFACRDLHMWEACLGEDPSNAAFHCSHAVDQADAICADVEIEGKSPYQHMRDGQCTYHHYGYCDLSNEGTVADCMKANIDDEGLQYVLQMLPPTVKFLFLNENEGITKLESGIFENLVNPEGLKALYMDDCDIETMDEDVFHPLTNLELLNLNFNKFSIIQDDLLKLPELRSFSAYGDPTDDSGMFGAHGGRKPGQITSDGFSNKIFQYVPKLERLTIYGHFGITSLPAGLFEGLSNLKTMYWVFCSMTNEGIPDGLWEPLTSLVHWDMQGNAFTELDPAWFGPWSSNLERILFFNAGPNQMDIGPITDESIFEYTPKLKTFLMFGNPRLKTISHDLFVNNPDLQAFAL